MSETKASFDATMAALAITQNTMASTEETPSLGGTQDSDAIGTSIPAIPETLTLIHGDLQKLCQGEKELVLFARNSKSAPSSTTAGAASSSTQETKQKQEIGILNYIIFTREIEKRGEKIISEAPSFVMYFLHDCELSSTETAAIAKNEDKKMKWTSMQ